MVKFPCLYLISRNSYGQLKKITTSKTVTVSKSNKSVMTSYRNIHEIILNTFLENYHSIFYHSKGGQAARTKENMDISKVWIFLIKATLKLKLLTLKRSFIINKKTWWFIRLSKRYFRYDVITDWLDLETVTVLLIVFFSNWP